MNTPYAKFCLLVGLFTSMGLLGSPSFAASYDDDAVQVELAQNDDGGEGPIDDDDKPKRRRSKFGPKMNKFNKRNKFNRGRDDRDDPRSARRGGSRGRKNNRAGRPQGKPNERFGSTKGKVKFVLVNDPMKDKAQDTKVKRKLISLAPTADDLKRQREAKKLPGTQVGTKQLTIPKPGQNKKPLKRLTK